MHFGTTLKELKALKAFWYAKSMKPLVKVPSFIPSARFKKKKFFFKINLPINV